MFNILKSILVIFMIVSLDARDVPGVDFDTLLRAIVQVESTGNHSAVNIKERAWGMYQIRGCVIEDVNNLVFKREAFIHEDAFNPWLAKLITLHYLTYWGKRYRKLTGKRPGLKVYARIWNGGPFGYKKETTLVYWDKILRELTTNGHQ